MIGSSTGPRARPCGNPRTPPRRGHVHSADDAQAFAHFRFGTWLAREGRHDESQSQLEIAVQLKPDSWAIRRQTWELQEVGKAGGPEFWAAVEALGPAKYYPPADLEGTPKRRCDVGGHPTMMADVEEVEVVVAHVLWRVSTNHWAVDL